MTSPAKPAGWYADPSGLPATRWWDGQHWTDHIQPGTAVLPPTAGLGGYYPVAAPSGPLMEGAHTLVPADPEATEIFAAQLSGGAGAMFPATLASGTTGGALAAPAAEKLEYPMPLVDAVEAARLPGFRMIPSPLAAAAADPLSASANSAAGDPDKRPAARHATGLLTHPVLLASVAAVVLAAILALVLLR
ncbi:DUF2510 domain-containing protein [Actinoplanes regularis]|uniref:DUF2510 domain-containing protein n=1 Tax=Actinoplanes regularis TaxID=52697 RepID=UPI00249FAE1C|nr:DUF2510 domain-containing protein [Actinoplanes regularis]GLW31923.1 hypothetical protein Areg01_48620 [Actinoplanes regularis]